ncbi:hypothetical protein [Pedobacter miscanthi]|uniref:Uncharacterized protein n=1 Tax=Pedobacter miscanthi TaxID=2259170 RepID=A0A366LDW4_9SPHI|nr:hypothetical protein [Pedobacter miscanthi]RBQ12056.1 hypothetical protein DRW42_02015 [Pedobacter miscanthi]
MNLFLKIMPLGMVFLIYSYCAIGQTVKVDSIPENILLQKVEGHPLSPYAFNQFLVNNYSFAILGTQTPVSGVKVETVKPSITLSGNVHVSKSKKYILNLELVAGAKEGLMEVFSKNKTSGVFKASFGLNMLSPWRNSGFYLREDTKKRTDDLFLKDRQLALSDSLSRINKYIKIGIIHQVLSDKVFFMSPTVDNFKALYLKYKKVPVDNDLITRETKLILEVLALYGVTDPKLEDALSHFVSRWKNAEQNAFVSVGPKLTDSISRSQSVNFEKNYQLGLRSISLAKDSLALAELNMNKSRYHSILINWFNISPSISNTSFQLYHENPVSLSPANSFVPALRLAYSIYRKYPNTSNRFWLGILSVTPKRTNSLEEMEKFSYKTTQSLAAPEGSTISSEETGTAYKGEYLAGFGTDFSFEGYVSPWTKPFIPGFYAKVGFIYGKPWVNRHQFPAEFGLLYNLKSSVKESVNLLSIIPYVAWSNLKNSVTYVKKEAVPLHDKFSFGVKVGVPINIGK